MPAADTVKSNVNTILLTVLLGLMFWMARTTYDVSVELAGIRENIVANREKYTAVDRDIIELRQKISAVELDVARLRVEITKKLPPP